MKILHTSDIHLKEDKDERWETLQKIIEIGKKEGVEILVISGDLFDKGINAENLRPRIREIFSNTGFKIVLIPGNHDSASYEAGMYFGDDVIILRDLEDPFEYKDVVIWGLPFKLVEEGEILRKLHLLENKLVRDKINILVYHGELLDVVFSRKDFGEEDERRYMPIKLSYFKNLKIDYVLAGHFHTKFYINEFEKNRYFIYPGSPVSITKKETGQRKVNIFEVGKSPKEYPLDTPHFVEVIIELDPFTDTNPVDTVRKELERIHQGAKVILTVKGYINSEKIKVSESEIVNQIEEIIKGKPIRVEEKRLEFLDVRRIIEDSLFKEFEKKLEKMHYDREKMKQMREVVIKAMMRIKS